MYQMWKWKLKSGTWDSPHGTKAFDVGGGGMNVKMNGLEGMNYVVPVGNPRSYPAAWERPLQQL